MFSSCEGTCFLEMGKISDFQNRPLSSICTCRVENTEEVDTCPSSPSVWGEKALVPVPVLYRRGICFHGLDSSASVRTNLGLCILCLQKI